MGRPKKFTVSRELVHRIYEAWVLSDAPAVFRHTDPMFAKAGHWTGGTPKNMDLQLTCHAVSASVVDGIAKTDPVLAKLVHWDNVTLGVVRSGMTRSQRWKLDNANKQLAEALMTELELGDYLPQPPLEKGGTDYDPTERVDHETGRVYNSGMSTYAGWPFEDGKLDLEDEEVQKALAEIRVLLPNALRNLK